MISLRDLWAARHTRGLEPVLKDINRLLATGEFNVEEWVQLQRQDPIGKRIQEKRKPAGKNVSMTRQYEDWSPASVFSNVAHVRDLQPVFNMVHKLIHDGCEEFQHLFEILEDEFGDLNENREEILTLFNDIFAIVQKTQHAEAARVKDVAIRGYAAQLVQKLWRTYRFRQYVAHSPIVKLRNCAIQLQRRWRRLMRKRNDACTLLQMQYRKIRAAKQLKLDSGCILVNWIKKKSWIKKMNRQQKAVIAIQNIWKTRKYRNEFKLYKRSSTRIQSFMRRNWSRKMYRHAYQALIRVQCWWRWSQCINRCIKRHQQTFLARASILLQCWWRGQRCIRALIHLRERQSANHLSLNLIVTMAWCTIEQRVESATKLQAYIRRFEGMRKVARRRRHVNLIRLEREQSAKKQDIYVKCIQSAYRDYCSKKPTKKPLLELPPLKRIGKSSGRLYGARKATFGRSPNQLEDFKMRDFKTRSSRPSNLGRRVSEAPKIRNSKQSIKYHGMKSRDEDFPEDNYSWSLRTQKKKLLFPPIKKPSVN